MLTRVADYKRPSKIQHASRGDCMSTRGAPAGGSARAISVMGAVGPARAWVIKEHLNPALPALVVTRDRQQAEELVEDLRLFGLNVELFPEWDCLPLELVSPSTDISAERLRILAKVAARQIPGGQNPCSKIPGAQRPAGQQRPAKHNSTSATASAADSATTSATASAAASAYAATATSAPTPAPTLASTPASTPPPTPPPIIVAPLTAISQRTVPPQQLLDSAVTLHLNAPFEPHEFSAFLAQHGYHECANSQEIGQMATRGSVIDIFTATLNTPLRIEHQGGKIIRLATFDPESQRTIAELQEALVLPARELLTAATLAPQQLITNLTQRCHELGMAPSEREDLLTQLKSPATLPGIELLQAISHPLTSPLEYFPNAQLIVEDLSGLEMRAQLAFDHLKELEERFTQQHQLAPHAEEVVVAPEELIAQLTQRSELIINDLLSSNPLSELANDGAASTRAASTSAVSTDIASTRAASTRTASTRAASSPSRPHSPLSPVLKFRSRFLTDLEIRLEGSVGSGKAIALLGKTIADWRIQDFNIIFTVGAPQRAERLKKLLLDINIDAVIWGDGAIGGFDEWYQRSYRPPVVIMLGSLSSSVELTDQLLVLLSEKDLFRERSQKKRTRTPSFKRLMNSLSQLRENDFMVHVDYGVGIYRGLEHREIEGKLTDFLHLEYADSHLYLPVVNIGKLQKYVAAEGQKPILDKLSSTRWVNTKRKIKEAVVTLAGDLIRLYATRKVTKGWRFEPWGAEDERFGETFPYSETQDQLEAIEQTIANMASEQPMDRLICGDVGFGKTEVAVRAAFKCVQHARQVAVLAPTTILAEQHRQTFTNRFADYPFKVGALSRFYSKEANKRVLEGAASGEIDVIVGTHKLLSKDVVFKDLGLLIIDEEHRFGVKQKEQLKSLRANVDVLTLTATPIPRTLHMALLGIRDMSVMSTPPVDRRTIRTYVTHFEDNLIRDAIMRELQRGGQCFFIHPRIQGLDLLAAELQRLVPEASVCFAHGQMGERQLEDTMGRFQRGEFNVLVSTTIVESGIDIPNANTIIIDQADMFGLSQLYQLRGRVGRSTRQAYCFFLVPKKTLTIEAENRLKALQALDELGLGFHLALRDMEIRGIGNLLGKEQSGNVLSIGFEMYQKILQEAIMQLRGEDDQLVELVEPDIRLNYDAYIPEAYIPDISERLLIYQRLAQIDSDEDAAKIIDELKDRFGGSPPEVLNLVQTMLFRALLRHAAIVRGEINGNRLLLALSPRGQFKLEEITALCQKNPTRYGFSKGLQLSVNYGDKLPSLEQLYLDTALLLKKIRRVESEGQ